jgi:hypothetical protein
MHLSLKISVVVMLCPNVEYDNQPFCMFVPLDEGQVDLCPTANDMDLMFGVSNTIQLKLDLISK